MTETRRCGSSGNFLNSYFTVRCIIELRIIASRRILNFCKCHYALSSRTPALHDRILLHHAGTGMAPDVAGLKPSAVRTLIGRRDGVVYVGVAVELIAEVFGLRA